MKTVSREKAQELKDAGWVKETIFQWIYIEEDDRWEMVYFPCTKEDIRECNRANWLPAPSLDEVLEEVAYDHFLSSFRDAYPEHQTFSDDFFSAQFSVYLNRVMRSADAAAEVWIKMKGEKNAVHQKG